jgi:hypothetical protein
MKPDDQDGVSYSDLAGARQLEEQVLAARRQLLGCERQPINASFSICLPLAGEPIPEQQSDIKRTELRRVMRRNISKRCSKTSLPIDAATMNRKWEMKM